MILNGGPNYSDGKNVIYDLTSNKDIEFIDEDFDTSWFEYSFSVATTTTNDTSLKVVGTNFYPPTFDFKMDKAMKDLTEADVLAFQVED